MLVFACSREMYVAKRVVDSDLLEPLEFVEFSRQDMEQWKLELVHRCIKGLQICLTRYPEHYKSLYRLAKLYYEFAPLKVTFRKRETVSDISAFLDVDHVFNSCLWIRRPLASQRGRAAVVQ